MKQSTELGYRVEFRDIKILTTESGYQDMDRISEEVLEMFKADEINREGNFSVSRVRNPIIRILGLGEIEIKTRTSR
jgi:hypothetical protein